MKIAYLDTIGGISGDMMLGASVSAGMPLEYLQAEIDKLQLTGVELQARHLTRNGIVAVKVDVVVPESAPQPHRHLRDILALIDRSTLAGRVKDDAGKIFGELARAEAAVHRSTVEKVHFHEVGAIDSIVDIVGAAAALAYFSVDELYTSPVKLGNNGFITAAHGKLPLPGPAATELLRGYPVVLTDIPHELTTPTGAAIVKALSRGVLSSETIVVEAAGYGAGDREMHEVPNLLRIMVGRLSGELRDEVEVVETNIDNMNPETYGYVIDRLLQAGAVDAFFQPVVMKKGRMGTLLTALVPTESKEKVIDEIFAQTTTIGLRVHTAARRKLPRSEEIVPTTLGNVRCKRLLRQGREEIHPEYEECRRIAEEQHIPLPEVYRRLFLEIQLKKGNL
jgi:uncharacterized protein (TIGR00299 family) protein